MTLELRIVVLAKTLPNLYLKEFFTGRLFRIDYKKHYICEIVKT